MSTSDLECKKINSKPETIRTKPQFPPTQLKQLEKKKMAMQDGPLDGPLDGLIADHCHVHFEKSYSAKPCKIIDVCQPMACLNNLKRMY